MTKRYETRKRSGTKDLSALLHDRCAIARLSLFSGTDLVAVSGALRPSEHPPA